MEKGFTFFGMVDKSLGDRNETQLVDYNIEMWHTVLNLKLNIHHITFLNPIKMHEG